MTEHDEIRKQLSAYCGGDLTPAERKRIEKHLSSCADCRAEVADLETTLRLVRSQPEVEPPPWLASRIMAQVREEAERQQHGWLQRLFLPLQAGLSLKALAVVLVCVVSYFIARDTGLLFPPPPAPSVSAPAVEGQGAAPQQEQQSPVLPPTAASEGAVPTSPAAPAVSPPPAGDSYAPAPPRPAPASAAPSASTLKEEAAPASRSKEAVSGSHAPALEFAPGLQKAAPEAKKSRALDDGAVRSEADSQLAAPAAPVQPLQVRLIVAVPEGADLSIRRAVAGSGGTVTGQPAPRQLLVRISARRLPELLGQLATLGRYAERPAVTGLSDTVEVSIRW